MKGHQAVLGTDLPTKDSVIEFRFRLGGTPFSGFNRFTLYTP